MKIGTKKTSKPNCTHRFFDSWAEGLDEKRNMFFVRSINDGRVCGNVHIKKALDLPAKVDTIQSWESFIHADDVRILEDAHSRALKMRNTNQRFSVRIKANTYQPESARLSCIAFADWCDGCEKHCGMVMTGGEICYDGETII